MLETRLETVCPTKVEKGTDLIHRGKHGSEGEGTYLKPTDRQRQQELTCTEAKDIEAEQGIETRETKVTEPEDNQNKAVVPEQHNITTVLEPILHDHQPTPKTEGETNEAKEGKRRRFIENTQSQKAKEES